MLDERNGGVWIQFLCRGEILRNESGKPYRWIGTHIDITGLKQIQEKLQSSEENFRTFFETIDDLIFIGNQQGEIFYTNNTVSRKLGYTPEELHSMHILQPFKGSKNAL